MAYDVMFAGVSLSDYCTVLNIERSVLPPRTNLSKSVTATNGSLYTGYRYGERTIGVEVRISDRKKEERIRKIRELASVLHTEAPCQLFISDEPNKYYYAVLDGATDLTRAVDTETLTLNFLCHDPIAYSTEWKSFNPDNSNIVTIENEGTSNANMNIMVEFNRDACFLQVTNREGRTVLIGKPKSEASVNQKPTPAITNEQCLTLDNFTSLSFRSISIGSPPAFSITACISTGLKSSVSFIKVITYVEKCSTTKLISPLSSTLSSTLLIFSA